MNGERLNVTLLPAGVNPADLRDWANAMDQREGRATIHSDTLRHLADVIPAVCRKIGEMGDKLATFDLMRSENKALRAEALFAEKLLTISREHLTKALEGEPEASGDYMPESKVLALVRRLKREIELLTRTRRRLAEEAMMQSVRADRAEADNAALIEVKGAAGFIWVTCAGLLPSEQLMRLAKALQACQGPHPGNDLRQLLATALAEVERLKADATMRDPQGLWQGDCGHIWDRRKNGSECPVCKELVRVKAQTVTITVHAPQLDPEVLSRVVTESLTQWWRRQRVA
jgi:rubrerythrin